MTSAKPHLSTATRVAVRIGLAERCARVQVPDPSQKHWPFFLFVLGLTHLTIEWLVFASGVLRHLLVITSPALAGGVL